MGWKKFKGLLPWKKSARAMGEHEEMVSLTTFLCQSGIKAFFCQIREVDGDPFPVVTER
jgi:hypothetical protein